MSSLSMDDVFSTMVVVVDPKLEFKIDPSNFYTKAKYSPFSGIHCKGKAIKTYVCGNIVFDQGEILGKFGNGKIIFYEKI